MQAQISVKEAGPQLYSVEAHAGYAVAKARMTELSARRTRKEEDIATAKKEFAGYRPSEIETEARAVVDGKRNDDSQRRQSSQIASLQNDLNILRRACVMQAEAVSEQQGIASREIVERARPAYLQLRRAYFLTLIELGKRAEEAYLWRAKLNGSGADGMGFELTFADIIGDPRMIGDRAIGSPTQIGGNIITENLRNALRRGDVRRDEMPAHWESID